MDFETYSRTKLADYAALAETVASILRAALDAYPETLRLQQAQHRPKNPESLRKKLKDRGIVATTSLEDDIKDLAGCRLIFYTNSDVTRFLQSGIIQDNFEVDWDRTKIHHPVPGQTEPDNLFISNNYVLKLKADRTALPEYARFSDLLCEVQVQTTLNHAWAEMEHDIIYKKPALKGFGGKLFEAIEQRLRKIMKDHLLPAGYEFQKALDDHERLLSGKELFDRGALKALTDCSDNNARYELLERFRDYVLPNYDDPQSVYPEIKEQLVAAVKAARLTRPRPIETPFGNLPGITVERIVDVVADILTHLRYVDIELTFDVLRELFPDAPLKYMPPTKHMTGDIFKGHLIDAMFNLTSVMTGQSIHLCGMPTEAIHTPFVGDRALSLENARYIMSTARHFGDEIAVRPGGIIERRAHQVLASCETLLERVAAMGLMQAIEAALFADVSRTPDGGRGFDGVFERASDYWNPFEGRRSRPQ